MTAAADRCADRRCPQVYVFLFEDRAPGFAGIYSLRTFSAENVPRETVIAFESCDDAMR